MSILIATAWDIPYGPTDKMFARAPKWIDSARFDIVAKASVGEARLTDIDTRPMLRALLIDRFKIATHYEDRLVPAYSLVAVHPRLKKADPSNRTNCKSVTVMGPNPHLIACQNTTMAQFVDGLRGFTLDFSEVADATGIKGAWDFSVNYGDVPESQTAEGSRDAAGQRTP